MATQTQQRQTTTTTQTRFVNEEQMEAVLAQTEEDLKLMRGKIAHAEPGLRKAAAMSAALQRARQLVTEEWISRYILPLMNSPLGFMCDRPNSKSGPYSAADLVEPVCECLIRGFSVVGNEMNVISGRFYGAQAGYKRLVRELPGVTDLEEIAGEPAIDFEKGKATIRFIVRCKFNGQKWELKGEPGPDGKMLPGRKFTIRVNAGMGPDAVIGKAARKAFKAAYDELTGTAITPEDDDPEPGKPEELPAGRHATKESSNGSNAAAPATNPPPEPPSAQTAEAPQDKASDQQQASTADNPPADEMAQKFLEDIKGLKTKPAADDLLGKIMKAKDYLGSLYREVYDTWKAAAKALK